MPSMTRLAATVLPALAAALLPAAAASADSVVAADPTAQNVTAYGVTSAWSRRADGGRYRLVVVRGSDTPFDAAVPSMRVPFDPDLGPSANNGRAIVYSRCANGSATVGCDVYLYDVASGKEHKVTSVSGRRTSEIGPSYFKGSLAFGRTGAKAGLYVKRPGKATRRFAAGAGYDQTDLSATRVIARATTRNHTLVRLSTLHGEWTRIVGRGERHEEAESVVASPVLARYRAFWLALSRELDDPGFGGIVESVSVRSKTRLVGRVDRPFAAVDSVALGSQSVPRLYSGALGISLIDPRLVLPGS